MLVGIVDGFDLFCYGIFRCFGNCFESLQKIIVLSFGRLLVGVGWSCCRIQ